MPPKSQNSEEEIKACGGAVSGRSSLRLQVLHFSPHISKFLRSLLLYMVAQKRLCEILDLSSDCCSFNLELGFNSF